MLKNIISERTGMMYSVYILTKNLYNALNNPFKYHDLLHLHELCLYSF